MDRKKLHVLLAVILTLSLTLMASCSKEDVEDVGGAGNTGQETEAVNGVEDVESEEVSKSVERDPSLDKEIEGARYIPVKRKPEKFFGSWTAVSEKAEFLYGNVELKIRKDGTWTGNVTDIDLEGTWKAGGTGITITDKEGLIDWKLFYTADGTLMIEDNEDPGNPIVLKPGAN